MKGLVISNSEGEKKALDYTKADAWLLQKSREHKFKVKSYGVAHCVCEEYELQNNEKKRRWSAHSEPSANLHI